LAACLDGGAPVVATIDYVCAYPHMVSPYLSNRFLALGTDGFGRSDTRAQLRQFFEVDTRQIVVTALYALALEGACLSEHRGGGHWTVGNRSWRHAALAVLVRGKK
jgi:pyruvate dehydrogenase complex dehydrogenase (E1) component